MARQRPTNKNIPASTECGSHSMSNFVSLSAALKKWFNKPLSKIPEKWRKFIEQDSSLVNWDDLNPAQRRYEALQRDYQHDPATEQDRQYWRDYYRSIDALKEKIAEWEAAGTPTVIDLDKQETRLEEMEKELAAMERPLARGDCYLERKRLDGGEGESSTTKNLSVEPADAVVPSGMKEIKTEDFRVAPVIGSKVNESTVEIGSPEWRSQNAKDAANARHDQPGGSRDKKRQMLEIWATGKYISRDLCAEQECAALDISFSAARNALKNSPNT